MNETNIIYDEDDYLHIGSLLMDYWRYFMRKWYILALLLIIGVGVVLATKDRNIRNIYQATVYYSLNRTSDVITDAEVTARVVAGVPLITSSADFRRDIQEAIDTGLQNAGYSFYATGTESSTLFSVSIRCSENDLTNDLLHAFEQVFPKWINKSIGKTVLIIVDEDLNTGEISNYSTIRKRIVNVGLFAVAIWLGLATIHILRVRKIHGEEDMKQVVDVACFGILPDVKKKKRDKSTRETLLVSNEHLDDNFMQSMRSIAMRVESDLTKNKNKILMITSTHPDEGKSLITVNLALILKRHGKRVVVVDGDIYQAGLNKILKLEDNTRGLLEYLNGSGGECNVIKHKSGLSIVPAGTGKSDLAYSTNIKKLAQLFKELREKADIILIDTPPTAEVGDAVLFSEQADGVIYVVRGDYAEVRDVRKGIEPFIQSKKLIGYILNRINSLGYSYGYRYGYGASYARYRNYGSYGNKYGSYGNSYGKDSAYHISDFEPESEE